MTITMTRSTYSRTASGKGWKTNPDKVERKAISRENYENRTAPENIRFMNGFCGGTCRAERGYTYHGYKVTKVTLVSPARDERIIERFSFDESAAD